MPCRPRRLPAPARAERGEVVRQKGGARRDLQLLLFGQGNRWHQGSGAVTREDVSSADDRGEQSLRGKRSRERASDESVVERQEGEGSAGASRAVSRFEGHCKARRGDAFLAFPAAAFRAYFPRLSGDSYEQEITVGTDSDRVDIHRSSVQPGLCGR